MDTAYPDLETIWPGWEIEELIGKGKGGSVYRAARSTNGLVMESAVKIISPPKGQYNCAHLQDEGARNSDFELYKSKIDDGIVEITSMLKLKSCSHVVDIEDFAFIKREDDIKWDLYFRMEFLRTLTDYLLEKQRLEEDEIIKLGLDLSEFIMQCYKNRIIHRDIKLENIFITEEHCYKISDFGIAIMMDMPETACERENKICTAPELYLERQYGKTTDLYSLGLLMYMLANGNKLPFFDSEYLTADNEEKERAFYRRLHGEKLPDTRYASKELNRIILKACSYEPEKRYPDAEALYADLKDIERKNS